MPVPGAGGRMWLCGKHHIGPDPQAVLAETGATTVVCLTQRHELEDRFPEYVQWLDAGSGGRVIWFPIHDLSVPTLDELAGLVDDVAARVAAGEHVVVHCAAGIGRAGNVATGVLVRLGMDRAAALAHVAAHRPMAGPEVGAQAELIAAYAASRATEPPA